MFAAHSLFPCQKNFQIFSSPSQDLLVCQTESQAYRQQYLSCPIINISEYIHMQIYLTGQNVSSVINLRLLEVIILIKEVIQQLCTAHQLTYVHALSCFVYKTHACHACMYVNMQACMQACMSTQHSTMYVNTLAYKLKTTTSLSKFSVTIIYTNLKSDSEFSFTQHTETKSSQTIASFNIQNGMSGIGFWNSLKFF